jgi:putative oxidoreductase
MNPLISIASRLLMALIFIISGWEKLTSFSGSEGYISSLGIPLPGLVTPLVILIELGGGLALLAGFKTRWVAGVLAAFAVGTALIVHNNLADQAQSIHFMKNLAIAGGLLLFVKYGAGEASIDERMRK